MTKIQQQVRRTIRRHALCPPGSRLLIGLSGGSDSVALTLLLIELADHGGFGIASLAHLNHGLRPSAARDEQFCRDLAARLRLAIVIEAADVKDYAASQRLSIEDAARRRRYEFLERAAAGCGADRIAVGHTEDDQAETYLIKLIRGAGLTGLGGIYPRRGPVVRPLLDVSRAGLRLYLAARGETWVEDETNDALDNPRNRIRHRVIPELDRASGGLTSPAIARSAALAREDGEWLDELAETSYAELTSGATVASGRHLVTATAAMQSNLAGGVQSKSAESSPDRLLGNSGVRVQGDVRLQRNTAQADSVDTRNTVQLDLQGLRAEPLPVQRRVLLTAIRRLADGREVGLEHVEAVREVMAGLTAGVDVPGSHVELRGKNLVLVRQTGQS